MTSYRKQYETVSKREVEVSYKINIKEIKKITENITELYKSRAESEYASKRSKYKYEGARGALEDFFEKIQYQINLERRGQIYRDILRKYPEIPPYLMESVDSVFVSVRKLINCLRDNNIRYVGDLLLYSEKDLLKYPRFGRVALSYVNNELQKKGLKLGLKHIEKWEFKNDNLSRMLFKTLCFGQVNPSNYSIRPYRYIWTESDVQDD